MHELITPAQMYQMDTAAIASGITLELLIDRAGRAVAEEITRRFGARKTVVLCGPGNKGRDGAAAAECLKNWGWPITISNNIKGAELIIDALYGAGLNREFPQTLADQINAAGVPVVSIDLPSGLDGVSGHPRGACVQAALTITFMRKKLGHVLLPGRNLCGEVVVRDIGIPESIIADLGVSTFENTKQNLPSASTSGHKFGRGHAVIVSGNALQTGASRLAASAALKIGAGLVTILGEREALQVQATHLTSIMLRECTSPKDLKLVLDDKRINALCIGPAAGVGNATKQNVKVTLASGVATVLDADALTSCANTPTQLFDWIQKNPIRAVVMAPHEGEFARLFKDIAHSSVSKLEKARTAAKRSGATVILKGADTVIAAPNGHAKINSNAPPSLATAGSGDVLAGLATGLLAQGMSGFDAACAAVWLHGNAANRLGTRSFMAEDLLPHIVP
ncbi:MAG: NAD(P)H-hydrate dehydratase [Alphaproteobacteria bacterium]|nr:NAD(P)H-hydrate dehydratase [Alphaproteobacteria bacterium]